MNNRYKAGKTQKCELPGFFLFTSWPFRSVNMYRIDIRRNISRLSSVWRESNANLWWLNILHGGVRLIWHLYCIYFSKIMHLTKSSKSPASIAKSNKQWVGTCLYQEVCKRLLIFFLSFVFCWIGLNVLFPRIAIKYNRTVLQQYYVAMGICHRENIKTLYNCTVFYRIEIFKIIYPNQGYFTELFV